MARDVEKKELSNALSNSMIWFQLERILASETFSRSERLSAFLRFIVEETLAGRAASLKEQVVGDALYGNGSDFDAAARPVVRVDARRLRDKLREYYSDFDRDAVIISLPKGTYVPLFEKNSAAPALVQFPVNAQPLSSAAPRSGKRIWIAAAVAMLVVASTAVLWFASRDRHTPPRVVPLTSYPGDEGPPSISPDGNLVVFTCRDVDPVPNERGVPGGNADICVKAVGTESVRRLTKTPYTEIHPTWSPDEKEIAFVRGTVGVFVMSHLGGHERKISNSGTHPCWSPDGKSILVRDRGDERSWAIYSIALDTLERRQLTFPSAGVHEWDFDVSPDGKTLAFIRFERSRVGDIYVVPMQGGKPRRLTNWNAAIESVTWKPDGRELIYAVDGRLWRIPANGARIGRGSPVPDIPMHATQASISRTGRGHGAKLVFRTHLREVGMRLIDLDAKSTDGKIQAVLPFSRASRNSIPGTFSPDGSQVAFISDRGSTGPNLWVVNRDGLGARQITFLETPAMGVPSWSPDGAQIAFDAVVDRNTDVYTVSVDGGKPVRLTSGPAMDGTPEWSPDGKWIYFSSTAGPRSELWKVPAEGGTSEQVTQGGGFQPRMSPDGEHLYYFDHPPGTGGGSPLEVARLLRMPIGGGEATLIHERIPPFYWSVSSRGIFFLAGDLNPTNELYRFWEGKVVHMGRLPFRLGVSPGGMAVSRDGRWALVSVIQRNDGDLMLLENFR